jgi:hypothetical protein
MKGVAMPPLDARDEEFIRSVAKATTALIVAHELGNAERAVEALQELLAVIAGHGTVASRKGEALARAVAFV